MKNHLTCEAIISSLARNSSEDFRRTSRNADAAGFPYAHAVCLNFVRIFRIQNGRPYPLTGGDFYGKNIRMLLMGFQRSEKKFASFPELVAAINKARVEADTI